MDKKTKDTLKTGLAAVGAFTVVTTAPVLAAGVAIGMLVTNPEKVKETAEKVSTKLKYINKEMEEAAEAAFKKKFSEEDENSDIAKELQDFFEKEDQREAEDAVEESEKAKKKAETNVDPCCEGDEEE